MRKTTRYRKNTVIHFYFGADLSCFFFVSRPKILLKPCERAKTKQKLFKTQKVQPFFLPSGGSLLWEQIESRLQVIQGSMLQAPVPETQSVVSDHSINPAQLCRHFVGVPAGSICERMTLRVCTRGRISPAMQFFVLLLLCVICMRKERTGKESESLSARGGAESELRGHFLFCFVFHFSSKPCVRWTRNKEKTRSRLNFST